MAEKYAQKAVGERIRAARKKKHLSQEDVASEIGASRVTVSMWERGATRPTTYLEPLARLLDLDPEELRLLGDVAEAAEEADQASERAEKAGAALAEYLSVDERPARRRATR